MPRLYSDHIPPHPDHPTSDCFEICDDPVRGRAVRTKIAFVRGAKIARFDGVTSSYATQHSLQKAPDVHLIDLQFAGLLAHSCDPNIAVDMAAQEAHALRDIPPGELLTMDYDSTEDVLFAGFYCCCGSPQCRGLISGRRGRAAALYG